MSTRTTRLCFIEVKRKRNNIGTFLWYRNIQSLVLPKVQCIIRSSIECNSDFPLKYSYLLGLMSNIARTKISTSIYSKMLVDTD